MHLEIPDSFAADVLPRLCESNAFASRVDKAIQPITSTATSQRCSKMGLDDFARTDWMAELQNRVKDRGFLLKNTRVSSKSHYFMIQGNKHCAVGKTHHSREENRTEPYINLNSAEEANWEGKPDEFFLDIEDKFKIVDTFGIIIDHLSPDGYNEDQDNFLVMPEDILNEIPNSGTKKIRIISTGYAPPFGNHLNDWNRIFKNLE